MIFNNVINRHIHPSIVDENLYVGHYHVCRCNIFAINTISNDHCVMYNVLSGLAACGRLGVAARPACLFGTRPVTRDQRHASHLGATPAD